MKVLLLTYGTRGDIQPFVTLARALEAAGHETLLAGSAEATSLTNPHGIRLLPVFDAAGRLMADPVVRAALEVNFGGLRGKRFAIKAVPRYRSLVMRALIDLARVRADRVDVVVHTVTLPLHEIAERMGVPAVPVCLQPMWVPTRSFPDPTFPYRIPRILNRASYLLTRLWWGHVLVGNIAKWRSRTLGLPRRRGHGNPMRGPTGDPAAVLQAFSRHVLPSPLDYPDWVHTTGFWYAPHADNWAPPPGLMDFLAAGDPPVYIGFGSMVGTDPRRSGRVIGEAARLAGVRAVVVTGSGGIDPTDLGTGIYCLDEAPFDWLFPRMAAIVHHGGSGTTGAALAAGRPQVICPVISDQQFYGRRMLAQRVAPAPQPQRRMTAGRLADAIRLAATDPAMAERAAVLGERVRSEGGVADAVKVLESLI